MKRLTGEELLSKLKELYGEDVSVFAYGDFGEIDLPEDFKYDKEAAEKASKDREAFYESIKDSLPENYKDKLEDPRYKEYMSMPSRYDVLNLQLLNFLGLGKVVDVDSYGGEDKGSEWYVVRHFVDHDVYIRTEGYYQSYNGAEFHEGVGEIVTKKEKTITVFE